MRRQLFTPKQDDFHRLSNLRHRLVSKVVISHGGWSGESNTKKYLHILNSVQIYNRIQDYIRLMNEPEIMFTNHIKLFCCQYHTLLVKFCFTGLSTSHSVSRVE